MRYANIEQELALLSINTFQKDLSDPNPLIRCMVLRVLSGINNKTVNSIVLQAVERMARDTNPYVRKVAAMALANSFR